MLHAVVMAGGSGTRFWPQSRRALPKQFQRIGTQRTLIQETVERCRPLIPPHRVWVVTGQAHADETQRQLPELLPAQVLVEPCPRNTAPCVGLAAIRLLAADPEAVMLVLPADHVIQPAAKFVEAVETANEVVTAQPDAFVLFGVPPNYPATGYGYIHRGHLLPGHHSSLYSVEAFKEKPDLLTAARYVATDDYYWNCGIFVWRAQTILDALREHAPEVFARLQRLKPLLGTAQWDAALAEEFPLMPSISIDYAVLEKAQNVAVMPAPFTWDDVGSWQALPRLQGSDSDGNTIDGLHCGDETHGCIIRGPADHLIATYGTRDLIIVHTPTATLVADKRDENSLKALIAEIQRRGLERFL
jgi:mannose-1-phosphate guanylyltransferase